MTEGQGSIRIAQKTANKTRSARMVESLGRTLRIRKLRIRV
jgi:hypothetical protein